MARSGIPEFEKRGDSRELVVLLHAYTHSPENLRFVRDVVANKMPDADLLIPELQAGRFSMVSLTEIVQDVLKKIDNYCPEAQPTDPSAPYQRIVLVGHSLGALLARKVYVCACDQNPKAKAWVDKVERIILLAGMNRGWSISHHLSPIHAILWTLGVVLGNLQMLVWRRPPLIFAIRRGGTFITELRIQWLLMRRHFHETNKPETNKKAVGGALTIQLLGSVDDMVSPEDNIDLVSGNDFVYLDVPFSGHTDVIKMDCTEAGQERRKVFEFALCSSEEQLEPAKVFPADATLGGPRENVTDVIFVIHGIRDEGFWTHKIARRVKALGELEEQAGEKKKRIYATETSAYGYFPMLPFLLPSKRRLKVEWLMDQYTEALAQYPNADFSFIGHSNGTYLLARALQDYPCCHFKHVVFAGSVVRCQYDWPQFVQNGQIKGILNFVATRDWVVAFFPKALQTLRLQDLGSAGHDGFDSARLDPSIQEVGYINGAHSAALNEQNWDSIAHFIVYGKLLASQKSICSPVRSWLEVMLVVIPGLVAPLIWVLILGVLVAVGYGIATANFSEWQKTLLFVIYLWAIWKILTKV